MRRDPKAMALRDLANHILPSVVSSYSKKDKEEAKKSMPKKLKKKMTKPPERSEPLDEAPPLEREGNTSLSIFKLSAAPSFSEDKFKNDSKATKKPTRFKGKR